MHQLGARMDDGVMGGGELRKKGSTALFLSLSLPSSPFPIMGCVCVCELGLR